jgi:transcriptional regulator with XRE-family HTH domain
MDLIQIGVKVRNLRKRAKMTQQQLATEVGVDDTMINKIERGVSCGSMNTLTKIAAALGVPLAELLKDEDPPNPAA